jgi:hypothetical protein
LHQCPLFSYYLHIFPYLVFPTLCLISSVFIYSSSLILWEGAYYLCLTQIFKHCVYNWAPFLFRSFSIYHKS